MPEEVNTGYDAILAIGKSLYAVVTGRAKRLSASIALDYGRIMDVIGTIHRYLSSESTAGFSLPRPVASPNTSAPCRYDCSANLKLLA